MAVMVAAAPAESESTGAGGGGGAPERVDAGPVCDASPCCCDWPGRVNGCGSIFWAAKRCDRLCCCCVGRQGLGTSLAGNNAWLVRSARRGGIRTEVSVCVPYAGIWLIVGLPGVDVDDTLSMSGQPVACATSSIPQFLSRTFRTLGSVFRFGKDKLGLCINGTS